MATNLQYEFDESELIAVEEYKQHLNVDHSEDDLYIEQLGQAAFSSIVRRTRRTVQELKALGGGHYPQELRIATVMLVAHWYRVREAVSSASQQAVPYSLEYLVRPFIRLGAVRRCPCND